LLVRQAENLIADAVEARLAFTVVRDTRFDAASVTRLRATFSVDSSVPSVAVML
jgi:hypothetical protein